jgi:hypothetical protein
MTSRTALRIASEKPEELEILLRRARSQAISWKVTLEGCPIMCEVWASKNCPGKSNIVAMNALRENDALRCFKGYSPPSPPVHL